MSYAVNWWGSHPDAGNDDCWTGSDYETLEAAREAFMSKPGARHTPQHIIAYVELDGPGVHELRQNPDFDARRMAREEAAEARAWRHEIAMEAGMLSGCDAYNEAMGY